MQKNTVFLEIGGNIENRLAYIKKTHKLIEKYIGEIMDKSGIFESPPWGFEADHNFLNQCLKVRTHLMPPELIKEVLSIEEQLGRVRNENNYQSRTVDVDVLFFENLIINNPNLQVPHPRMHLRKFVLLPLSEIAADYIHPLSKKTIQDLLVECKDQSPCIRLEAI